MLEITQFDFFYDSHNPLIIIIIYTKFIFYFKDKILQLLSLIFKYQLHFYLRHTNKIREK